LNNDVATEPILDIDIDDDLKPKEKKRFVLLSSALFLVLFHSCNTGTQTESQASENEISKTMQEGFEIVTQNCVSCHSPNATQEARLAPPLLAVKKHYSEKHDTEEAFVGAMRSFLTKPTAESSEMPNAVEKFGLMPNLGYTKEQLSAVAAYIYNTDLEKPGWNKEYSNKDKQNTLGSEEDYLKEGQRLAMATKSVLGKNLLSSIQHKGPEGALVFCNERAIPLTDSMAQELEASIKRVSDKNRNPGNLANEEELAYIKKAKLALTNTGSIEPHISEKGDRMIGYYPILTNAMCLKCHGSTESDIDLNTLSAINARYPNDNATGYKSNELRGIWVIEMKK